MFRKMRRIKQQLPEAEALEILKTGKTAVLAVLGDEGYPYTVPVNYVLADNGKIYFHCARSGHKLDALRRCDKVSLCVVAQDDVIASALETHFRSVIAFGRARILADDAERFRAAEIFGLKYCPDKAAVDREIRREWDALCVVEITIEHLTGKEALALTRARSEAQF